MKAAVLGGSFNPLHIGHLALADAVCTELHYDSIFFVPTNSPPHKEMQWALPPEQRLRMVQLACEPDPRFHAESCEIERGGVSYAIDTVREIVAETPGGASGNEFYFIVGEDSVDRLGEWKDIDELRGLCAFKAYPRTRESSTEIRRLFAENGVGLNPDARIVEVVRAGLARKNAFCPCRLQKIPEFFCPCDEFRAQLADPSFHGLCHCRLYLKP